ncbi:MAG: hypothetical protein J7M25_17695 [Deltaproteobacteria bacterium]|nr:hypothetical protein [Deltaproteobacteria bacterium]
MTRSKDMLDQLDQYIMDAIRLPEHSADGLSDEDLVEAIGGIGSLDADRLERLNGCLHCRTVVEAATAGVEEVGFKDVAVEATGRFRAVFLWAATRLQFVWGTSEPLVLVPASGATRGGPSIRADSYNEFEVTFKECTARIQVEQLPSHGLDVQVGVLSGTSSGERWRASLWRGDKLVESVPLEKNLARFSGVQPVSHVVRLARGSQAMGQIELDIVSEE